MDHLARWALGEFASEIEQRLPETKEIRGQRLKFGEQNAEEVMPLIASLLKQKEKTEPLPDNATQIEHICYFAEAMYQAKRGQPEPANKNTEEYLFWLVSNYGSREVCGLVLITQLIMLGTPLASIVESPEAFLNLFVKSFDYIEDHPRLYRQWNSASNMSKAVVDPGNFIVATLRGATAEGLCSPVMYALISDHVNAVCGVLKKQIIYADKHMRIYGGRGRDLTVDVRTKYNTWTHMNFPENRSVPLSSWKRAREACLRYKGEPLVGELSHARSAHVCKVLGIHINGNQGILGFSHTKKRMKAKGFG